MDKFTTRDTTGAVDITASVAKYTQALTEWTAANEIASDRIEAAVESVFDNNSGRLPMPALINFAVGQISSDPNQFKALQARVHAYIKGQREIGRLKVAQGVGGGVSRVYTPGNAPAQSA